MNWSIFAVLVASATCLFPPSDPEPRRNNPVSPVGELAGNYYFSRGIGLHYALKITPGGQFEFHESGCLGEYDYNSGAAKVVDGHLVLKPRLINPGRIRLFLHNLGEGLLQVGNEDVLKSAMSLIELVRELPEFALTLLSDGTPTDFLPIRWGERIYLVPRDEDKDFCNAFNQGLLSRYPGSGFYLREGDAKKQVEGFPGVPEEWKSRLLAKPLHGEVFEVLSNVRATVDFGSESGAWTGMSLSIDSTHGWAEVVEVGPKTCVIEVHQDDSWVEVGRKVQTRRPDPE